MPLIPKRVKYRKVQRGSNAGLATSNNKLDFGDFALQTLTRGFVSNNQIEAARVAITRHLKRRGKVWIRLFPYRSFTKKPLEVRMGKGKGNVEGWNAPVKPGRILFEIADVPEELAREAMRLAMHKLPIKCKFVVKETEGGDEE
jgi:large subunit ribosomal protein L16